MNHSHLIDDTFYNNLCNDLLISHKTIGTNYGEMYSSARQTSQGRQRANTVNYCPNEGDLFVHTHNIDLDTFQNMAYVTPTAINIMRDISKNINL
jgi:hypothetical protein